MGTTNGKVPGRVKIYFCIWSIGKRFNLWNDGDIRYDLLYGCVESITGFCRNRFFVAKLWDAFNDLFMGMIVDNTRSRFGKFVPWLVIGTLVNSVVFVVLFTDFKLTGTSLCIFVAVIYV